MFRTTNQRLSVSRRRLGDDGGAREAARSKSWKRRLRSLSALSRRGVRGRRRSAELATRLWIWLSVRLSGVPAEASSVESGSASTRLATVGGRPAAPG